MTHLSVNVNKLATLRNSRGGNRPDVTAMAAKILRYGVYGITVHPRPDGRHIRASDVDAIASLIRDWNHVLPKGLNKAEFNIEGYPSEDFLKMIERIRPNQCTLVPDPPEALTSNAGWKMANQEVFLTPVLERLRRAGVRASLFVDPAALDAAEVEALRRLKPDRIELYTEAYADAFPGAERARITAGYRRAAELAKQAGIGVNAGHDLDQANLAYLVQEIPWIDEVSIGHALMCEALEQGLETTIGNYLKILAPAT